MQLGLESSLARMCTAVLYVGMGAGVSTKHLRVVQFRCVLFACVVFGHTLVGSGCERHVLPCPCICADDVCAPVWMHV